MTDIYKVLGQSAPAAATPADIYTVPSSTSTVVSTLKVCNRGAATTFRVSIAVAGAVESSKQFLYYDQEILANDAFSATEGWTLATTDVVRVQSASGNCSFSLFGMERT